MNAVPTLSAEPRTEHLAAGAAANYLGVSIATLRAWTRRGLLRAFRASSRGHRRWQLADLQEFAARNQGATHAT